MVARKLSKMIVEHPTLLRNKSNIASSRPLLVLLDRNADLITAIQHTSTYQALIDDLLTHKANRVEFEVGGAGDAKKKATHKRFDLDPDEDPFYKAHKFQPFPEAIESNASELEEVTARESEIRSKAAGGGAGGGGALNRDPMAVLGTNELATAVESLPALLDRKTQLEMHTSILQAVMNQVAARDVPQFYELESSLATGQYKNDLAQAKSKVIALVETKGNVQDKIRLIMVYALTTSAKMADLDQVTAALQQAVETDVAVAMQQNNKASAEQSKETLALGLRALGYLKQLRSMHMIPSAADMIQISSAADGSDAAGRGGTSGDSTMFSSFMKTATTQASGLLAKATDKVSSMLGKIHKHHATVVVENLCEMKPNAEDEAYLYLDPKVKGDVDVFKLRATGATRAPIRSVLCFVIGGGSYGEYQNLQMLTNDGRCQSLTYGSTEILDANDFLKQLGQLG
jgi:sec1 family domain-containing protein 1